MRNNPYVIDFGAGAGTTGGTIMAAGLAGVFANVAGALGSQQAPALAEYVYTAMRIFSEQMKQTGGACRAVAGPDKCGGGGGGRGPGKGGGGGGGGRKSFGADTLVLTKEGLKPIQDVRVGELVAARNPDTGAIRWQPVTARMVREAPQVMRLTVRDHAGRVETVVVTENHPYLRADGTVDFLRAVALEPRGALDELQQSRWTGAGFLKAGDTIQSARSSRGASDAHGTSAPGTLTVVASELVLSPTRVYNFEVAGDHTYAVGELQAWVHNSTSKKPPSRKNPNQSEPDSASVIPGKQIRIYGPDGQPLLDIDLDHCHGQGRPHQHKWPGPKDRGAPGTPVPTRKFPNKPPL